MLSISALESGSGTSCLLVTAVSTFSLHRSVKQHRTWAEGSIKTKERTSSSGFWYECLHLLLCHFLFIRYLYDDDVDVFVAWLFITLSVPEPPGDHPAEAGGVLLGAEILGRHVLLHHAPVPQRQQPAGAGPGEGRGLGAGAVLVPGTRRSAWSGHGRVPSSTVTW